MTIAEILAAKSSAATASNPPDIPAPSAMSFFKNAFARDPSGLSTLAELIERVRSDEWADQVATLRSKLARGPRLEYDEQKRNLPAVMVSGWTGTRDKKQADGARVIHHSGYLQGDFDGKDHTMILDEEADTPAGRVKPLLDMVKADPHVQAAFVSPSGEGVKAIIRVPASIATHKAAWLAAAAHFETFGLKLDPATKDPGRLCFVSHDPDAWLNKRIAREIRPLKPETRSDADSSSSMDTTAADLREMLGFIPPRPAYDEWLRIASAVWSVMDEHQGVTILNEWSPEEVTGEYAKKFKHRLKEVRVGSLAWYAQQHGFDPREAARKKMWCGRLRFSKSESRDTVEEAPDDADGPVKHTACAGEETPDNPEFVKWCLDHEQRGDAELWRRCVGGHRKYDHFKSAWFHWDGQVWRRDETMRTTNDFIYSVADIYRESYEPIRADMKKRPSKDPKKDPRALEIKTIEERIKGLHRTRWLNGCMEFARTVPELATTSNAFDSDHLLFAVENGVVDFRAGEFREAHPGDMLTQQAGVRFSPDATCPKFDAFMKRSLVDDEIIRFTLRAMAYSLTGLTDEDMLFFCYGSGSNGKSTFINIMRMILGGLMVSIDIQTLLTTKSDQNADYKKATLEGRRIAVTDEIPEGRTLSESMVKALIGGDHILARRPYEKPYSFAPTHKLWMIGNHKPVILGTDHGIWRRICLIPWTQTIADSEKRRREDIMADMRAELPGILNRLILAWMEFQELGGLKPPAAVRDATKEYRDEQDQLGSFLAERTEKVIGPGVRAASLLKAYLAWCEDNGERPAKKTSKALVAALRERGHSTGLDRDKCTLVDGLDLVGTE